MIELTCNSKKCKVLALNLLLPQSDVVTFLQRQEAFGAEMDLLLPIVIGAVTAFTLLLLVTILIVKKKKSQLKYDTEKAQGHSDESQKLKSEEKFTSTR